MTFVDTNVFMYAVGRSHPLRTEARNFFQKKLRDRAVLATSAEVLQELLHAYLPVDRLETFDAAMKLVRSRSIVWDVGAEDVELARALTDDHPQLEARDLLHLACCKRRDVKDVKTYDRALSAVFLG